MTLEQLMALMAKKATRLKALATQDTLTDDEKTEKRTLFTECTDLKADIKEAEETRDLLAALDTSFVAAPAAGQPGATPGQNIAIVGEPPVYRSLGIQLQDVICVGKNAAGAVQARERLAKAEKRMEADKELDVGLRNHLDKEQRDAGTGQTVGITADGGGFVQTDFATDMIHTGFNNSAILPKTQKRVMSGNSNSIEIFGIDEKSRANGSRNGGVAVYTKAELEKYDSSKVKFIGFEMKVNKLTGMLYLSDEIMEDASFLGGEVTGLFGAEFEFKTQLLLMSGKGVGEPLGIENSKCLISIDKEGDQVGNTIMPENIDKMIARIAGGGAEFYGNRDIYPQLSSMYRKVDSNNVQAMYKPTGLNSGLLNGVPTTFIEQAPTLGDAGDLGLYDWTQYVTATKGGFKKAESMHFKFDYGQKAIKFTLRFDGQPRWRSAITPFKGAATTSPFIRIKAR